jgi:hypothetical protein
MPRSLYMGLRYIIVIAIYILFSKDWKAISQMFFLRRLYYGEEGTFAHIYIRSAFVIVNEILMFAIVVCCNIGEERGIGVVVNFSAALIIVELDDLIMATGRI